MARGARVYAEIIGYGCSGDAYHITSSHPDGRGAEAAMLAALKEAQITPEAVDHVNAHATSTPTGDVAELNAIRRIFHDHPVLVTANKGSFGHLLGAAGAVESIITILSLYHSHIPPTLNLEQCKIPLGSIEIVTSKNRSAPLKVALCNSFGFGGTNVSLCFART